MFLMSPAEYINKTIGKPWVNRATGPNAFDCWGLVIDSFRRIDGVELPMLDGYLAADTATDIAAAPALADSRFEKCGQEEGAIVCCYDEHGNFAHVGRILAGGVLHAAGNQINAEHGQVKWSKMSVLQRRFTLEFRRYVHSRQIP